MSAAIPGGPTPGNRCAHPGAWLSSILSLCPPVHSYLLDRRVIGRLEEHRLDLLDQRPVLLRLRLRRLPRRVGAERGPALVGGRLARVRQDVDHLLLRLLLVDRAPEADQR